MEKILARIALTPFMSVAVLATLLAPSVAVAESLKEQIVGTWQLVAIYNEEGGKKSYNFGEKPVGLAMFDRSGHVIQFLSRPEVPKFAVPNRLKGSDKEYREAMHSFIAGFGTYMVEGSTVTIKWTASSYPNRIGTSEKRTYKIVGNEMTGVNPNASSGGTSYTRYVRVQ